MRTLVIFLALLTVAHGELRLTKVDAMTRVMRTQELADIEITLEAARGEWESLQVIVTGPPVELKGVTLEATLLNGPDGGTIPAPKLLREHYVRVSKSTPMSPLPVGDYPDALVPQDFTWQELPNEKLVNSQ